MLRFSVALFSVIFFDILTLIFPAPRGVLVDATIDLHGEALVIFLKVSWEALVSSFDRQSDRKLKSPCEEYNQEDNNRFEKLPANIGKCKL